MFSPEVRVEAARKHQLFVATVNVIEPEKLGGVTGDYLLLVLPDFSSKIDFSHKTSEPYRIIHQIFNWPLGIFQPQIEYNGFYSKAEDVKKLNLELMTKPKLVEAIQISIPRPRIVKEPIAPLTEPIKLLQENYLPVLFEVGYLIERGKLVLVGKNRPPMEAWLELSERNGEALVALDIKSGSMIAEEQKFLEGWFDKIRAAAVKAVA